MKNIEYERSTSPESVNVNRGTTHQQDVNEPLSTFLPIISSEPTNKKAFNFINRHIQLQLLTQNDADTYFNLFKDAQVTTHTGGIIKDQQLRQNFELAIVHNNRVNSDYTTWVVRERNDMVSIGIAVLTVHKNMPDYGELGVMLLPGFHNQGDRKSVV